MNRRQPPPPDPLDVELLGELVYCWKCKEWWPADGEFFATCIGGIFRSPCRACIDDGRRLAGERPCIVEGCGKPRATWRLSRCKEHLKEQKEAHEVEHYTRAAG